MVSLMNLLLPTKPNLGACHISSWALREEEERKGCEMSTELVCFLVQCSQWRMYGVCGILVGQSSMCDTRTYMAYVVRYCGTASSFFRCGYVIPA
jgi:hypothetical protein